MHHHCRSIKSVFKIAVILTFAACKKDNAAIKGTNKTDSTIAVVRGTDPAAAITQGFFLDGWQPKALLVPSFTDLETLPPGTADATVSIDPTQIITKVPPYMYGNNINPYMTQVVTEPVLIRNLNNLAPKIIRAPGGSLSDLYFWNAPDAKPPVDVPGHIYNSGGSQSATDTVLWYGKNTAPWTLSIDNYYQTLLTTNSTGIITVNYGYARYGTGANPVQTAAHLAANWVRYDKGRTKYWEVGNENYGIWEAGYHIDTKQNKDGQPEFLTGALYGKHFKIFADSMRKAAAEVGAVIKIGAVMTVNADLGGGVAIPNWNADVVASAGSVTDFYVVHNYYTPYAENSTAATILNTPFKETQSMMSFIRSSTASAPKPVALTEWNIQATGKNQNVSNIAGVHAAMVLGETIQGKYGQASRWDLANNWANGDDLGMFNMGDEPGGAAKWAPRPTFFYMYYFQKFFGDRMVTSTVTGSADIVSYASTFSSGQAGVVLVNKGSAGHVVTLDFKNFKYGARYYYYTLNGGTEDTFSRKVYVNGTGPSGVSGGLDNYTLVAPFSTNVSMGLKINVPAYGAVFLTVDSK